MSLVAPMGFFQAPAAASGPPAFVAAANFNGTNIPVPSGTLSGHFLLAYAGADNPGTLVAPSGWTQIGTTKTWAGLGYGSALYYRIASGSEPASYSFASSVYRYGMMLTYSGATAVDAVGSLADVSGTSMTLTGITSAANSMLLALLHDRDAGVTITVPSGMTQRVHATSGTFFQVAAAELANASNANRIFTAASSMFGGCGVLVSIK